MSPTSPDSNDSVQAQVEALIAVAKKLNGEGNELQALEAYKTAASLMLGAPWLQLRTAELARKLHQPESATQHYRRAASAFIRAGFPKRALAPLRAAWQVAASLLPRDVSSFITITLELTNVQRELGLSADAKTMLGNANQALRAAGSTESVPLNLELERSAIEPKTSLDSNQSSEPSRPALASGG